ncbi:MAG: glycosyltransferase [Spirochaetaceae bacterium]|nr:MAG: glycosyltransferase [Spirochaetaceae bacterium]
MFEGINGLRNRTFNSDWMSLMASLTEERVQILAKKHGLIPVGREPWVKRLTAGSDDHAGLLIGRTYTDAPGDTVDDFILAIQSGKSTVGGRHNDFRAMSFGSYKIAVEFGKSRNVNVGEPFSNQLNSFLFENKKLSLTENLKLNKLRSRKAGPVMNRVADLIDAVRTFDDGIDIDDRIDTIYDRITKITDEFVRELANSAEKHVRNGSLWSLLRSLTSSLPGFFLSAPFVTAFLHMFKKRDLLPALKRSWGVRAADSPLKVLWFTDTIDDLNGVSVTLSRIAELADEQHRPIKIVASLGKLKKANSAGFINLKPLTEFPLPYYESMKLRIPSFLSALKTVFDEEPDVIYLSSPGPIGLLGLALGKLTQTRTIGVYHTDFSKEVDEISDDDAAGNLIESYLSWFFRNVDEIRVPTQEYITILSERGYDASRMSLFRRGLDTKLFSPGAKADDSIADVEKKGRKSGFSLVYTGRISKDKNLDLLIRAYDIVRSRGHAVNLTITGDGPYLDKLIKKTRGIRGLLFTGRLKNAVLPGLLASADLFVFPSNTDTFGMSVLEAQACGVPCLVSIDGGPKEIVIDGLTGFHEAAVDPAVWADRIERIIDWHSTDPDGYVAMRNAARQNVVALYDWDAVLDEITGIESETERAARIEAFSGHEAKQAVTV